MNEHYKAALADLEQMQADAEAGIVAIKRLMSRNDSPSQGHGLFDEPHAGKLFMGTP